ncbi:MAG: type II toxin-antitoxin system HicA family toxin [Paracoccus sp. (in: a-proteobacteria)]|uniref:type II toxin-antitoxin system HicA family toxin n=1 Tax=Paracoccus sp. TaxID=267 RepID=UPI0039E45837
MEIPRNSRDILRRLAAEGWDEVSVRGSHHKLRKDGRVVIVPHPKKDLPIGTARSIARIAGWLEDKE